MGTCVYLWWIHVDVWQNQHNIVKELTSNKLNKFIQKKKKKLPLKQEEVFIFFSLKKGLLRTRKEIK